MDKRLEGFLARKAGVSNLWFECFNCSSIFYSLRVIKHVIKATIIIHIHQHEDRYDYKLLYYECFSLFCLNLHLFWYKNMA